MCLVPSGAVGSPQFDGATFFMEDEIWKDIEGFEGLYQISSLGNVKSLPGFKKKAGIMKPYVNPCNKKQYRIVFLRKEGEYHTYKICRGVGKAFVANPENKPQINHINGIKIDDRAINLEWVTGKENAIHAVQTGLIKTGHEHHLSKFTKEQVLEIRTLYNSNIGTRKRKKLGDPLSFKSIAATYKVSPSVIRELVKKITYKEV